VLLDDEQTLDQALDVVHAEHRREQVDDCIPIDPAHTVAGRIEDLHCDLVLEREDRAADFELRARLLV
jgi:hypothetical protein